MVDEIKSKEDAERILKEKIGKFAEELAKIKDNFGEEASKLLNSAKDSANTDASQRAKVFSQLENSYAGLWTYIGFILCVLIIIFAFVFIGYFKIYKPLADKEVKQMEKKNKKGKRKLK